MPRFVLTCAAVAVAALFVVTPALAKQCPKLIAQINAAAGNRFDAASHQAKDKAAEAQKLHNEGKHPESEKAANEGLATLGITK
jgi:ABC-type sugar transport system substrate-binding protein